MPQAKDQDGVGFRRYDAHESIEMRDTVHNIHARAYASATKGSFGSSEEFMRRFDSYVKAPGFELVLALADDGEPVGQAWGWPLMNDSAWWKGLEPKLSREFTAEDGHRTFALSEVMVAHEYSGRGIAHRLHDELLGGRSERRATLLVRPTNERARSAYLRWGWQPVSQLTPNWDDAPVFDVLILQLH